jgi:hypothetical protein
VVIVSEATLLEFILQVVNLTAERELRHVQALGGVTHVHLIGHGHKVSQMAQLHNVDTRKVSWCNEHDIGQYFFQS